MDIVFCRNATFLSIGLEQFCLFAIPGTTDDLYTFHQ